MIRFILKRKTQDIYNGMEAESFETVLVDVPELESLLTRGGCSNGGPGYDQTMLIGAEIVAPAAPTGAAK